MEQFNYYKDVITKKYAQFTGRARRSEFWYFILFNLIIQIVLGGIGEAIGFSFLESVYSLAVLVPSIAVAIRRMHDIGKSGWFCIIPFYNIYLAIQEGESGDNQYGPNPKGLESGDDSLELED